MLDCNGKEIRVGYRVITTQSEIMHAEYRGVYGRVISVGDERCKVWLDNPLSEADKKDGSQFGRSSSLRIVEGSNKYKRYK